MKDAARPLLNAVKILGLVFVLCGLASSSEALDMAAEIPVSENPGLFLALPAQQLVAPLELNSQLRLAEPASLAGSSPLIGKGAAIALPASPAARPFSRAPRAAAFESASPLRVLRSQAPGLGRAAAAGNAAGASRKFGHLFDGEDPPGNPDPFLNPDKPEPAPQPDPRPPSGPQPDKEKAMLRAQSAGAGFMNSGNFGGDFLGGARSRAHLFDGEDPPGNPDPFLNPDKPEPAPQPDPQPPSGPQPDKEKATLKMESSALGFAGIKGNLPPRRLMRPAPQNLSHSVLGKETGAPATPHLDFSSYRPFAIAALPDKAGSIIMGGKLDPFLMAAVMWDNRVESRGHYGKIVVEIADREENIIGSNRAMEYEELAGLKQALQRYVGQASNDPKIALYREMLGKVNGALGSMAAGLSLEKIDVSIAPQPAASAQGEAITEKNFPGVYVIGGKSIGWGLEIRFRQSGALYFSVFKGDDFSPLFSGRWSLKGQAVSAFIDDPRWNPDERGQIIILDFSGLSLDEVQKGAAVMVRSERRAQQGKKGMPLPIVKEDRPEEKAVFQKVTGMFLLGLGDPISIHPSQKDASELRAYLEEVLARIDASVGAAASKQADPVDKRVFLLSREHLVPALGRALRTKAGSIEEYVQWLNMVLQTVNSTVEKARTLEDAVEGVDRLFPLSAPVAPDPGRGGGRFIFMPVVKSKIDPQLRGRLDALKPGQTIATVIQVNMPSPTFPPQTPLKERLKKAREVFLAQSKPIRDYLEAEKVKGVEMRGGYIVAELNRAQADALAALPSVKALAVNVGLDWILPVSANISGPMAMAAEPAVGAETKSKIDPQLRWQLDALKSGQTVEAVIQVNMPSLTFPPQMPFEERVKKARDVFLALSKPIRDYLEAEKVKVAQTHIGYIVAEINGAQAEALAALPSVKALASNVASDWIRPVKSEP